jgi:hypothetical protein
MKAEGFEIPSAEKKKDGRKEPIQEEVFEPISPSDGDFFGHDLTIPITCEDVIDHMKSCMRCSKVIKGHFDTQRELREQPMNSLIAQFANVELNLGAEEKKEADEGGVKETDEEDDEEPEEEVEDEDDEEAEEVAEYEDDEEAEDEDDEEAEEVAEVGGVKEADEEAEGEEEGEPKQTPFKVKGRRLCSKCKKEGHNIKTCRELSELSE